MDEERLFASLSDLLHALDSIDHSLYLIKEYLELNLPMYSQIEDYGDSISKKIDKLIDLNNF